VENVKDEAYSVNCGGTCHRKYYKSCAGIGENVEKFIAGNDELKWFCERCNCGMDELMERSFEDLIKASMKETKNKLWD